MRVVEDGPVRTVIEACFRYADSCALITYRLSKAECSALDIDVRLQFMEKNCMVKLSVPGLMKDRYIGQTMFGTDELHTDGRETVSQQWVAAAGGEKMLTLINNGTYGSDFCDGEIRVSLLRSAAYTGHPIYDRKILPQNRFMPRIDQGERLYRFVLQGGSEAERSMNVSREAQLINEQPYALSFFPSGGGDTTGIGAVLEGEGVQLTALRPVMSGEGYVARLFNPAENEASAVLKIPVLKTETEVGLKPYEIITLRINNDGSVENCGLLE